MDTQYLDWYTDRYLDQIETDWEQLKVKLADPQKRTEVAEFIKPSMTTNLLVAALKFGDVYFDGTAEEVEYVMRKLDEAVMI